MVKRASECRPGDIFMTRGKRWTHCGYYSAVYHVCAEAEDGERKVVSAHENVELLHEGTPEEAAAALAK